MPLHIACGSVVFAAVIVPVLMAVYYSFFSWDGVTAKVFIRFDNYRELLKDPVVWKSLTNSLKMAFWCVLLQLPIGMAFSVILFNRKLKGRGFSGPCTSFRWCCPPP